MKKLKTLLVSLMALSLCLSMMPMSAFAAIDQCPECKATGGYHIDTCSKYVKYDKDDKDDKDDKYPDTSESESTETPEEGKDESAEKPEEKDEVKPEPEPTEEPECKHVFADGKCTVCGASCTHNWQNGKCYECGAYCKHTYEAGFCTTCGIVDPTHKHSFDKTGKCVCGEQHTEHSWTPTGYGNGVNHNARCTVCGATETQSCNMQRVYDHTLPGYVYKCDCGYWMPAEDTHDWGKWEPDEKGNHVAKCTDPGCDKTRTEECKLEAFDDGDVAGVKCSVCGWVKYNDGTGTGGGETCEHKNLSTTGTPGDAAYSHYVNCMDCHKPVLKACDMDTLWADGQPVAHYCTVCGYQVAIKESNYCNDGKPHDYGPKKESLSEDGKSVLTTMTCKKCGYVFISEICNSPSQVTVNYVYEDGKTAAPSQSVSVIAGMDYSVTSPTISGYEPDQAVISGKCTDGKGAEYTVTYKKAPEKHTLTIHYQSQGGEQVYPDYTAVLAAGESYSVNTPPLNGYDVEQAVVSGTMPAADEVITVKYTPHVYTWTINYVDADGNPMQGMAAYSTTFDVTNIKGLANVTSPTAEGYTADQLVVSAPTELHDVTVTVTYTRDTTPAPTPTPTPEVTPPVNTDPVNTDPVNTDPVNTDPVNTPPIETNEPEVEVNEPEVPLNPEPEVEVDEPEVPLNPEPEVEVDEPDVPLTDEPEVEIDEPDVPLADEPEIEIDDEDIPLADVPQTGDISILWYAGALFSVAGLLALNSLERRQRKEDLRAALRRSFRG